MWIGFWLMNPMLHQHMQLSAGVHFACAVALKTDKNRCDSGEGAMEKELVAFMCTNILIQWFLNVPQSQCSAVMAPCHGNTFTLLSHFESHRIMCDSRWWHPWQPVHPTVSLWACYGALGHCRTQLRGTEPFCFPVQFFPYPEETSTIPFPSHHKLLFWHCCIDQGGGGE